MTETSSGERRTNGNWFACRYTQEKSNNQRTLRRKLIELVRYAEERRVAEEGEGEFSVQRMRDEASEEITRRIGVPVNLLESVILREDISPRL